MELFSFSVSGLPLLLSASDTGLFLHPIQSGQFGRPVLLCSNYKSGLCGCEYKHSLYYTYINRENALLLRRLGESTVLFRLEQNGSVICHSPHLIVFDNTLFLFYLEETPDSCVLRLHLPFTDTGLKLPDRLQTVCPTPPLLSFQTTGQYLYLLLSTGTTTVSYRYTKETGFEPILSEADILSKLRLPWEDEKKQLERGIVHALRLSEQHQNLLNEKEQELQLAQTKLSELSTEAERTNATLSETVRILQTTETQLTECEQSRQQTEQKLQQTTHLLERAKAQYTELMQVAEQYRQEALKWYGKFADRH